MKRDPERDLWLPSRRSFFFLGASAAVGAILPPAPPAYFDGRSPFVNLPGPFLPELDPRLVWIEAQVPPFITTVREIERAMRECSGTYFSDTPRKAPPR